jgi:hypothetical protein
MTKPNFIAILAALVIMQISLGSSAFADPDKAIEDAEVIEAEEFEEFLEELENTATDVAPETSGREYLYDGQRGDVNDLNAYLRSLRSKGQDIAVYVDGTYIGTAPALPTGQAAAPSAPDTGEISPNQVNSTSNPSSSETTGNGDLSSNEAKDTSPNRRTSTTPPPDAIVVDAGEAVRVANSKTRGRFSVGAYFTYLKTLGPKLAGTAKRKYGSTDARIDTEIQGNSAADKKFKDEVASMFCPGQKC